MNNELMRNFEMYNRQVRLENPWIRVVDYDTRSGGVEGRYTVVERKDAAIVILEHPVHGILLVNSYRYPVGATSWEIPMGGIEKDETPILAATRELKEETGLETDLRQVGVFCPIPGLTPQRGYVFCGDASDEDYEKISKFKDIVDEIVGWRFAARDEIKEMIKNGDIQDGMSIAALMIAGL